MGGETLWVQCLPCQLSLPLVHMVSMCMCICIGDCFSPWCCLVSGRLMEQYCHCVCVPCTSYTITPLVLLKVTLSWQTKHHCYCTTIVDSLD